MSGLGELPLPSKVGGWFRSGRLPLKSPEYYTRLAEEWDKRFSSQPDGKVIYSSGIPMESLKTPPAGCVAGDWTVSEGEAMRGTDLTEAQIAHARQFLECTQNGFSEFLDSDRLTMTKHELCRFMAWYEAVRSKSGVKGTNGEFYLVRGKGQ